MNKIYEGNFVPTDNQMMCKNILYDNNILYQTEHQQTSTNRKKSTTAEKKQTKSTATQKHTLATNFQLRPTHKRYKVNGKCARVLLCDALY